MSFLRPTLSQLRDAALSDIGAAGIFDADTGGVVNPALLRFDPLSIMGRVMAGLAYEQYGYLDWISLQATPVTATGEALLSWGALVGLSPKPPTPASGTARFAVTAPASLPGGALLSRNDGTTFVATGDATLNNDGTATVAFQAVDPGAGGAAAVGSGLVASNNLPGVGPGVVLTLDAPGTDMETNDEFRARVLSRFAAPPNGGSAGDYVGWALAVPGVTRAWVATGMGPGTVTLFVMFDDAEAGTAGFPVGTNGVSPLDNNGAPRDPLLATGDQRAVADALIPLQPVTALVYVAAPVPTPIDFAVQDLGAANTEATRAAIAAALSALFNRAGDPRGATLYPSDWTAAIAGVPGIARFTVAQPAAPVPLRAGQLPVLGQLQTSV